MVERARAIVESDGRALLEIMISDGPARARVGSAEAAAPPRAA
jgi:hypothetical protein